MKKMLAVLISGAIVLGGFQVSDAKAAGSNDIVGSPKLAVLVDGRKVKFEGGDPVSENGRVQVPLRGVGEALGAEVGFSGKTVTYTKEGKTIVLTLGSNIAVVDGKQVKMDTQAKAVHGRTYVPLRFVSENLGESVEWDGPSNWVWIGKKDIPTLEEAGSKNLPISQFKSLYGKATYLMKDSLNNEYSTVNVLTADQLPVRIGDIVYYDIWEISQGEYKGLKLRASTGGNVIYFLSSKAAPRDRSYRWIDKNSDGTKTSGYVINSGNDIDIDPSNYKKFRLGLVEYIGIYTDGKAATLIVNPFK